MTDKQYLEAVSDAIELAIFKVATEDDYANWQSLLNETVRRLKALKAQEDNIKSDHWEEKEILGDKWEDFKEYIDGIDDWGMSDVERYMNR